MVAELEPTDEQCVIAMRAVNRAFASGAGHLAVKYAVEALDGTIPAESLMKALWDLGWIDLVNYRRADMEVRWPTYEGSQIT